MNQSSKMKEKVYDFDPRDFNSDDREVAAILLQMPKLHIAQVMGKRRKLKITLGGKPISKIREKTYNGGNVHLMPQINILDVVMENLNNPVDISAIHGVPNNNILQCCKPFEKKLSASDLKVDQNRLFVVKGHVEKYCIPLLRKREEKIEDGINVIAYDMQGRTFNMKFIFWSKKYYVLNGSGWMNFFQEHSLQANQDHVKLWMFRHSETNNIYFALSVRRE